MSEFMGTYALLCDSIESETQSRFESKFGFAFEFQFVFEFRWLVELESITSALYSKALSFGIRCIIS